MYVRMRSRFRLRFLLILRIWISYKNRTFEKTTIHRRARLLRTLEN